jgi:HK97 family phage major capsid protein
MNLQEIMARLAAIQRQIENRDAPPDAATIAALTTEADSLLEQRNALIAQNEQRETLHKRIAAGLEQSTTIYQFTGTDAPEGQEGRKHDRAASTDPAAAPEYRTGWLKKIRGMELTDTEKRAISNVAGSGAEVIPTQTANQIISRIQTIAPILGEVTLLHVRGAVKFAVEGVRSLAEVHTENQEITPATVPLVSVSLSGFEIVKLVQISGTVMNMSIPAFESWIVTMLSESLALTIENLMITGDGSGKPKGIDTANTWDTTNSITVAASASLTAANVQALIGLLNAGYDRNAKFLISKRTLYADFMPLQDNSKNSIVRVEGNKYFIYGYL